MIIEKSVIFQKTVNTQARFIKQSAQKAVFILQSLQTVSFSFDNGIYWILATNYWNDSAIWVDTETWND